MFDLKKGMVPPRLPEEIAFPGLTLRPATPSSDEEEDDEFDDSDEEFSFSRFGFQSNATHSHITQRLKQPLLPHDDEGDVLVSGEPTGFLISRQFFSRPIPESDSPLSPQGVSDRVVDHSALHGGPAGAQVPRHVIPGIQHHLASAASQAGQEAERPRGAGPGSADPQTHGNHSSGGFGGGRTEPIPATDSSPRRKS